MDENSIPSLSIIVPIYNVEKYIENCLLSIERQTFHDFEVIMIDDGSTDKSNIICKDWAKKDNRFYYFYQKNQGLGPARNRGIELSRGERILFIDSDDWVDNKIVEELLIKSINTDADIVYGDLCVVFPEGKKVVEPVRSLFGLLKVSNMERIDYSFQRSVCGAVYKKKIWTENSLFMPNIVYEDTAVYGILLCYAKKIETVPHNLYFYRAHREGSLMHIGRKDYRNMIRALDCFLKNAEKRELLNRYSKHFFRYCKSQLGRDFRKCEKDMPKEELISVKMNMETLLSRYFPNWKEFTASGLIALGSYSACDVYNRVTLFRDSTRENYPFTTLESLMSGELTESCYDFHSDNEYRIEMVEKDLKKLWKRHLSSCKYVILDLLEERHDIIMYNNCYFTKSEAFDEVCYFSNDLKIIAKGSEERRKIWRYSCDAFFNMIDLEKRCVFVLELYLCEYKGIRGKEILYDNLNEIRTINKELKYYYDYIKSNFPDVYMISMEERVSFTSLNYPYGVYPWHYNEIGLFRIAEKIMETLY